MKDHSDRLNSLFFMGPSTLLLLNFCSRHGGTLLLKEQYPACTGCLASFAVLNSELSYPAFTKQCLLTNCYFLPDNSDPISLVRYSIFKKKAFPASRKGFFNKYGSYLLSRMLVQYHRP